MQHVTGSPKCHQASTASVRDARMHVWSQVSLSYRASMPVQPERIPLAACTEASARDAGSGTEVILNVAGIIRAFPSLRGPFWDTVTLLDEFLTQMPAVVIDHCAGTPMMQCYLLCSDSNVDSLPAAVVPL